MSQRIRRPTHERPGPIRNMAAAYRVSERDRPKRTRTGSFTSTEDVVMQAVKVGYKIADEQILKGQDFARRLRGAAVRSEMGDLGDLVDHGLRLARQLAILFLEFAETGAQPQAILKAMRRAAEEGNGGAGEPAEKDGGPGESPASDRPAPAPARHDVPILVSSSEPTSVSLKLHRPLPSDGQATVFPLYSSDGKALNRVSFTKRNGTLVLSVDATNEPRGLYRGCALDPSDQGLLATIEVEVGA